MAPAFNNVRHINATDNDLHYKTVNAHYCNTYDYNIICLTLAALASYPDFLGPCFKASDEYVTPKAGTA